ncbi:unnamed protein product [Rhizophagus irregularis]|nr:unnamed protein product [Rhizophagus irregularis]
METYEITFEEKTPLYYSSQEIFSKETEEDLDTSFDKLSELELFEFNEKNYINVQNALEQEVVKYSSDENEEEFGTYEDQEVPPPPVEDANEPVYRLNPAMYTNFSPCILDNKLQTCGQTKNVRNLCQLVGVWQIDAVSEYQSKGIPLGLWNWISGKRKTTCEQHKLHKEDTSKSLKLLAQWLTYVVDTKTEEKKEIILTSLLVTALKFLYTPSETLLKYEYYNPKDNTRYLNLDEFNNTNNIDDSIKFLIEILPKLLSYFFLKLLLNINCIMDIIQPKLD